METSELAATVSALAQQYGVTWGDADAALSRCHGYHRSACRLLEYCGGLGAPAAKSCRGSACRCCLPPSPSPHPPAPSRGRAPACRHLLVLTVRHRLASCSWNCFLRLEHEERPVPVAARLLNR